MDCKFCSKIFKTKAGYLYHLERVHLEKYQSESQKFEIINEIHLVEEQDKSVYCHLCQKKLSNQFALDRHQKNSCSKNNLIEQKAYNSLVKTISNDLQKIKDPSKLQNLKELFSKNLNISESITELESPITESESPTESLTKTIELNNSDGNTIIGDNINTNSNNNNNIKVDVKLVNLGNESPNAINDADFISYLYDLFTREGVLIKNGTWIGGYSLEDRTFNEAMTQVFKKIHCNQDHPENHNIYISNQKAHLPFKMFKKHGWEFGTLDDLDYVVIQDGQNLIKIIDDCIEENPDLRSMLLKIRNALINGLKKGHISYNKKLKKQIFNTGYSNKDLIKESYRKTKDQEYIQQLLDN